MSQNNIHEQHLELAQRAVEAVTKPSPPPDLLEIWLHGSVARGEDNDRSDVDLLLILAKGGSEVVECVGAVVEFLDQAQIPIRPRSRRLEKYPGTVQIDTAPADEFQDSASLLTQVGSSAGFRDAQNTINFWQAVRAQGRRLYPKMR